MQPVDFENPALLGRYFSRFLCRLSGTDDPDLRRIFAGLSVALTGQHSCIALEDFGDTADLATRLEALRTVGDGTGKHPLVLERGNLFLSRYFQYEVAIATRLTSMNREVAVTDHAVDSILARHFPQATMQKLAAFQALTRQLTIIAGGPGTGKTFTVAGILRALNDAGYDGAIGLAAPTGKATMKLSQSLAEFDAHEVKTLHRLLGMRPNGRDFRHGPNAPLPIDLLIVDEVSMVDLAMMARLLSALPIDARLILLGDPGQLPSVEAGNMLADICKFGYPFSNEFSDRVNEEIGVTVKADPARHTLQDSLCELNQNHRFNADRGIGRLSAAIRAGNKFTLGSDEEISLDSLRSLTEERLLGLYADYIDTMGETGDAAMLARRFEEARILTPTRDGPFGVEQLNAKIEAHLVSRGLAQEGEPFYHGRPILVTRNDYNLKLFNGDIGICVVDGDGDGEPTVIFRGAENEARAILPSRLPEHETCFAMTVHKSQGSEFDSVMLVLPNPDTESRRRLLTREMVYTAITRARRHVHLFFDGDTLTTCLARQTIRHSGLGERFIDQDG